MRVNSAQTANKDQTAMSDSLIGKQLGDYQIRDLLGRGGMARVYTGYDARLDRVAAVKVINSDFSPADQAEYFERFQREARAIARLNHPNIVGVYQFGQYEESYYMAMVFVEGRDLRQILREYSDRFELIPVSDVLNVVRGIGSALDYAHSRGVIHRDIKPSNIMLTAEGNRAILTDFGLALSTSEGTRGETFGSAHYIAPEQAISSAKAVPQSDLYSLGICLYEMLTGKVPFDDPSAMTVALKHLQDPPPPPRSINPKLSAAVEHVLLRAIDKDPAHRYPSGAELTRALEGAIANQTLPDTAQVAVKDVMAAVAAQSNQNATSLNPETPAVSAKTTVTPGPADSAQPVPKKNPAPDSAAIVVSSAVAVVPVQEVPPPPADAISTERGISSAIKPPDLRTAYPIAVSNEVPNSSRSRSSWLIGLLALVFIALLLGGYSLGKNAGLFGSTEKSVTPAPTGTENSQTTLEVFLVTVIPTIAATESSTQDATVPATMGVFSPTATATVTVADTLSVSSTAASTVVETATVNSIVTMAPTAFTPEPTSPPSLLSPSANPTLPITADATPNSTATISATVNISASTTGAPVEANDVLLLYNIGQLDLYNQSTRSISLTGITFNQIGTDRTFAADAWIKTAPSLKPGECYRLFIPSSIVIAPSQNPHLTSPCVHAYQIMAFYGPRYAENYYFWAAIPQTSTPQLTALPTSFTVLYNGQVIAICAFSDGRCTFSLTKSAN